MKLFKFLLSLTLAMTLIFSMGCDPDDSPDPGTSGGGGGDVDPAAEFDAYFSEGGNDTTDPGFAANSIIPTNDLGTTSPGGGFIDNVTYKGAVDPNAVAWYGGWTAYEQILAGGNTTSFNTGIEVIITDADMQAAGDVVNWTKTNKYVLDGFVFVNAGQTLNIEAGTIIQGKSGEGSEASALIVARGATINATGTVLEPIIFTFEGDNGGQSPTLRGQWGGLIILGNASLNSTPGESAIEGIPTNETRGLYGGSDDTDNSGVLQYVSIRHGGTNIGADNEINGLTLGGVGNGTVIENIEVVSNRDDGIEWFGGTVRGKNLIVAFCGDDGLDYDEGYRGENQYVIVHQDPTADSADRGGEHDGGTDPEDGLPYATPAFYNVTSVGNAGSRALTFRDNAGGEYHNSIFVGYGRGVDIEDLLDQDQDAYQQFVDGNLKLENNIFHNVSGTLFSISN